MTSLQRFKYSFLANAVFVVHIASVGMILFGWYFRSIHSLYVSLLAVTLALELTLGYCIFTAWEFNIRRKIDPNWKPHSSFIAHYMYKLFNVRLKQKHIDYTATTFYSTALVVNIFFWA